MTISWTTHRCEGVRPRCMKIWWSTALLAGRRNAVQSYEYLNETGSDHVAGPYQAFWIKPDVKFVRPATRYGFRKNSIDFAGSQYMHLWLSWKLPYAGGQFADGLHCCRCPRGWSATHNMIWENLGLAFSCRMTGWIVSVILQHLVNKKAAIFFRIKKIFLTGARFGKSRVLHKTGMMELLNMNLREKLNAW